MVNIMSKILKTFLMLTISILMFGCSGTGFKNESSLLEHVNKEKGNIFVYRESAFAGSALVISLHLNGELIGTIGNGETVIGNFKEGDNTLVLVPSKKTVGDAVKSLIYVFEGTKTQNYFFFLNLDTNFGSNAVIVLNEIDENEWKNKI